VSNLPEWFHKDRGALYHSEREIECEDHLLAIKLIEALAIAWEALEHISRCEGVETGVALYGETGLDRAIRLAKDAMGRIQEMGK